MSMLSMGSNLIGGIGSFFGGRSQQRAYEDMARQIQQYMEEQRRLTGEANSYLMPWQQAGQNEIGGYQANYRKLMDPNFINQLMQGYKTSDWAAQQLKSGNQAIGNAASASGQLNSGQFGKDMANYAQDITSRDQSQYLDRLLQQFGIGLGHQGSMVGQGYGAANQMGQNLIGMGDRGMQSLQGAQKLRMQGQQAQQGGFSGLMQSLSGLSGGMGSNGGMGMNKTAFGNLQGNYGLLRR